MQELQRLLSPLSNEILGIRNHRKYGKLSDRVEIFFTIKLFNSPDKLESIGTVFTVKLKITDLKGMESKSPSKKIQFQDSANNVEQVEKSQFRLG